MKIDRLRLGFATNSSSSHSMILFPEEEVAGMSSSFGDYFDRDTFTLVGQRDKLLYVGSMVYVSLKGIHEERAARLMTTEIMRPWLDGMSDDSWRDVDHQSEITVPLSRFGSANADYIQDLVDWISRPNLVVLGGDDEGGDHPLYQSEGEVTRPPLELGRGVRAKKDGDWWTLFSGRGSKIRFSFKDEPEPFVRSKSPDLVDLKITDYCTYGCKFCYQGSTPQGLHATLDSIRVLAREMGEAGVFEVAIGGGEPTLHPNFLEVLEIFASEGVTPNFTTKNTGFIHKPVLRDLCGSIGVSIQTAQDLRDLIRDSTGYDTFFTPQYVMGSTPFQEYLDILNVHKTSKRGNGRLLLLGYKTVGRGREFEPHPYTGWYAALKEAACYGVSIDTMLAAQSQAEMVEVPQYLYSTQEGLDNMYVDLVQGVCGPSSFCAPSLMVPLEGGFQGAWGKIQAVTA